MLLEQDAPQSGVQPEPCLRRANSDDLAIVTAINAGLAVEESGVNPMTRDPQGMLERTERRIAQGRVWLLTEDGKTIFKADVISDTPQVAFVEGVFVRWQERRKGHGLRCITQLARNLLTGTKSICLVVNEENAPRAGLLRKGRLPVFQPLQYRLLFGALRSLDRWKGQCEYSDQGGHLQSVPMAGYQHWCRGVSLRRRVTLPSARIDLSVSGDRGHDGHRQFARCSQDPALQYQRHHL